jgi:hypothetical protein
MDKKPAPTIRDLYPHLSENELAEAEQILERYLTLVLRIFERTDSEANQPAEHLTRYTGTLPCTHQDRSLRDKPHQQ